MPENEELKNTEDYAILIGIDNYVFLDPLKGAQEDIAEFQEWLMDPNGGSVPISNIHTVLSPPEQNKEEPQPVQDRINMKLEKMGVLRGSRIGRRLYFYFSGHGYGQQIDDVGMLMGNAGPHKLGYNIGLRNYRNFFLEWGFFDEVIFILDCCRDPFQRVETGKPPFNMDEELLPTTPPGVNPFTILACAYGKQSFMISENPGNLENPETSENNRKKRGVLTLAVLEGLKDKKATDSDGNITASSLMEYISTRIPQLAGDHSQKQDPVFDRPGPVREIMFVKGLNMRKRITIFLPKGIDKLTILDNEANEIAEYIFGADTQRWRFNYLTQDKRLLVSRVKESPVPLEEGEGTHLKVELVQNSWYELVPSQGETQILDLRKIDSNEKIMSSNSNEFNGGQTSSQKTQNGILKIKVPHWLVQVRIYDSAYKLITYINEFKQVGDSADLFEAEADLTPGIYEIEVALANKVERKLVSIKPGKVSPFELSGENWKSIKVDSPIPLDNTFATKSHDTRAAEKGSATKTMALPGDDANVFLYVQISENRIRDEFLTDHALFSEIFNLKRIPNIDEINPQINEAASVIDFNQDIVESSKGQSICYNANLPAGFYILELVNDENFANGKNVKNYQPVFLHRGWSTQIFISTNASASKAFSLNMAKIGEDFRRNDEAAMAAETIFSALSLDVRRSIVNKEEMKKLLAEDKHNPWLGILAAYALITSINIPFTQTQLIGEESKQLLDDILRYLKKEIPDHPDVRALHLELDKPAEKPFYYPPLIYKGLKRVKKHAEKFESTVPCDSLTDYVLRTMLTTGSWVTWEEISVPASSDSSGPNTHESVEYEADLAEGSIPDISNKPTVELTGAVSSRAPIFRLSTDEEPLLESAVSSELPQVSSSLSTLQEAYLMHAVQEITEKTNYYELPDTYSINLLDSLSGKLSGARANEISLVTGLPSSRVNTGIVSILEKTRQFSDSTNKDSQIQLSHDEQLIIKYAFQVAGDKKELNLKAEMFRSEADDAKTHQDTSPISKNQGKGYSALTSIEEFVARLKSEKDRIVLGSAKKNEDYDKNSQNFAYRLQNIANELLKSADFMAVSNSKGKIIYGNGAFVNLISYGINAQNEIASIGSTTFYQIKAKDRMRNLVPWESAFQELPLGNSKLDAPGENGLFEVWEIKRSQIEEQLEQKYILNILRGVDAPSLSRETNRNIGDLLCDLEKYTPLYARLSNDVKNPYLVEVEKIINNLEMLLR